MAGLIIKAFCNKDDLKKLSRGDVVDFFPDPRYDPKILDKALCVEVDRSSAEFLIRAEHAKRIYEVKIPLGNLAANWSGQLALIDPHNFFHLTYFSGTTEYEIWDRDLRTHRL